MKVFRLIFACLTFVCATITASAQGSFGNLDFELANITGHSSGSMVPITNALPGWTAYYGRASLGTTNTATDVGYDFISLGGAIISVNDTNIGNGAVPIHGRYSLD